MGLEENEEDSINIDIETFIKDLDNEKIEKDRKDSEILDLLDYEDEKRAKKLLYLVDMHIAEDTLITKCLKQQGKLEKTEK